MRGPGADLTACACGYAIGSIPVGLLVGRAVRGLDVREQGSGSIGTTNVLRLAGPSAAALTFGLDVAKGAVAVGLARRLGADRRGAVVAGFAAMIGHCWPAFARFRGGKGVATGFGAMLAVSPQVAAYPVVGGLAALAASRTVSVGSLSAAVSAVAGGTIHARRTGDTAPLQFAALATALIVVRHAPNIGRLLRGSEPRLAARRRS
ncbi:MAG: glycerol-3-phosphate 1-O-acyltransferase PlsY [Candidatus Dormibacteraeota bacterium]|nr:glycerol-3-phosphate 1-O-acyltransferase PlsY [Candidatus Dormibacteraeota bacterium]MBV8444737.1 glycerol-3-phosphate 1-O-acyltransferase PlsY [Candidatus Dormibacteraeota bacterium]